MSSHYISLAWLPAEGLQLFTFDYRGYGKSNGDPEHKGVHEDAIAALEQAWTFHVMEVAKLKPPRKPEEIPFVIFGQSLGGAISMRALVDSGFSERADLIVMDSSLVSFKEIARRKMAGFWLTWPLSWIPMVFVSDRYAPVDLLPKLKTPVLVIHDRHDPVVPFECGQRVYDLAPVESRTLWVIESPEGKGQHINSFNDILLRKKFLTFMKAGR